MIWLCKLSGGGESKSTFFRWIPHWERLVPSMVGSDTVALGETGTYVGNFRPQ